MNETIAAISTANGPGAIGIIRISGDLVLRISSAILFKKNSPPMGQFLGSNPRISVYCELRDGEERLDQIVCVYYKAPHSYTGEDLIELNLHGNPLLLKTVLQLIFRNGARPAKEGEFTKRAFLNNKLNLSEAEAVGRLIAARSRLELELSQKNIFGEISRLASRIRSELISLKAECEAEIDFSTEDLTFESLEDRNKRIKSLGQLCSELIRKSEITEKTISGTKVVIYGAPNTGKSSLLNCIVGKNRAITSHNPGTTRDYISEDIQIEGIPVQLVDTAGVRETSDPVERTGIEQSEREFESARVRLVLFDASSDINLNGFILKNEAKLKNSILVINKIDLKNSQTEISDSIRNRLQLEICEISCLTKFGIENLLKMISAKIKDEKISDDFVLLEERHRYHLLKIAECMEKAAKLLGENTPAEIYIKEIDYAIAEIGQINGRVDTEEILGRIFSKFCVGK